MSERTFGLGIDLGTSNSAISRVDIGSGRPDFSDARDLGGHREIPSVVYFHRDGEMQFGHVAAARANAAESAPRVVTNVKLLLRSNTPLVLEGLDAPVEPKTIVRGLLSHLKMCAERTFKDPCSRAVISVPAHEQFDVDYRAMVREAAMVGDPLFESISTIPEPDAVLMSIGDLSPLVGKRVLVFDMGGGTLDVSLREVDMREGKPYLAQLAVVGSDAAGRRVTEALSNSVIDRWERDQGFTFSDEERAQALRINYLSIDDAKRNLSSLVHQFGSDSPRAHSCLLISPQFRAASYDVSVQARDLTALSRPVCEDAIATVEKALATAGCTAAEVDTYFVVGGSSQLPLMDQMLREFFGRSPAPLAGMFGAIDATLAVVRGAAVEDLNRSEAGNVPVTMPELERKIPYAISIVTDSYKKTSVLVPAGSVLPFGPVERQYYLAETGDTEISIILVRGEGDPQNCTTITPATVELLEPGTKNDVIQLSWYLDESGELIIRAFDHADRELGVVRSTHY